ncbi:glycosyltransferase family 2 protein [Butyrivibrio sp. AC2005]|uniref:glycosyltransferase family 2 protein n=1 Tax=Butyrivibrio sp. AC2005 TaxID=1280672 RepID=UPI000424D8EE|nr:glycosyltransferase family 2 protein [Butyrivibrio sp. AC2005]
MCCKSEEGMVSVIIPVYNCENYIINCLESVCSQTYKALQIIVVDDGSSDNSYKLIKDFSDGRPEFLILRKENGGVSSARNLALKHVRGEYVYFLDADDYIEKDSIGVLVSSMRETGSDWVSCQYSRWDTSGKELDNYNFLIGERCFSSNDERFSFAINDLLNYYVGFEVWDKLYKAEVISNNNIAFSEKCSIGEDLAFNLKYLMNSKKLVCIADRCVRYTVRDDSAMGQHDNISSKLSETIVLLQDVWEYAYKSENQLFIDKFALICIRLLDNSYRGYSPKEVCVGYKDINNTSFILDRYKGIEKNKKAVIGLYQPDIAKIKFRYHMLVYHYMIGLKGMDRIKLKLYDVYRKLRHREPLLEWKMPY